MSTNSLAQNYAQKQQNWTNDPFELGCNVKGLTAMTPKRNLTTYTEELVSRYAKYDCDHYELSLDMVPEDEQGELARLYIESIDREIDECIYGGDLTIENNFTCSLLSLLQSDSKEDRERFAKITRTNVINYYKPTLDKILSDACDNYLNETNNEQGLYARQDLEHGDVVWGRF